MKKILILLFLCLVYSTNGADSVKCKSVIQSQGTYVEHGRLYFKTSLWTTNGVLLAINKQLFVSRGYDGIYKNNNNKDDKELKNYLLYNDNKCKLIQIIEIKNFVIVSNTVYDYIEYWYTNNILIATNIISTKIKQNEQHGAQN